MTSTEVPEVPDTQMDNPAQMLEDTWTTPNLPLNGPHAVLAILHIITSLSHHIVLMMAIDPLIRSAFKNRLQEGEVLVLIYVNLPGVEVVQLA